MATASKQELAEELTVVELRELAGEQGIDIAGLTAKADLVDAVVEGTTAAVIQAKAKEEPTVADETNAAPDEPEEKEALVLSEPLGPRELVPTGEQELEPRVGAETPLTPEEQQEAGLSPADLELGPLAAGPKILVKQNPETPSPQQVDSAVGITTGPAAVSVMIAGTDSGVEVQHELRPDDAALISSRVEDLHPAHKSAGHWTNPNMREMTDEEKEANEEAYASRFG